MLREFYDASYQRACDYDARHPWHRMSADFRCKVARAAVPDTGRVLDAGCASGEIVSAWRRLGVDAYGFDLCPDLHDTVYAEARPYVRMGRFDAIPYGPDDGFRTLVSYDVFEHVPIDQLEATGLIALMAQCGMPVPASHAQMPCLDGIWADIGDEQAIEQSLSTFSSHLVRIQKALQHATSSSLVLLDELGAGTDPEEGGALGSSILDALHARSVRVIASTHLSKLKDFAYAREGAENGSMAFDPDALRPLYRLEVGIPGASQALHIAKVVGIDEDIVQKARSLLVERDSRLEEIIGQVQRTRRAAEEQRRRAEEVARRAVGEEKQLAQRTEEVERRESWIREEAEHVVDEELRAARDLLVEPLKQFVNAPSPYDERARGLLRLVEGLLQRSSLGRRREKYIEDVKKGHIVYVPRFRRRCEVKKIDRKRRTIAVDVGGIRMDLPFDDISWLQPLDS